MKKAVLLLVLMAGAARLPAVSIWEIYRTGFELAEGYEAGTEVGKTGPWTGQGTISAEDCAAGAQSLKTAGEATLAYPTCWVGKPVGYVDFFVRPVADDSTEPVAALDADGAGLAFLRDGETGVLYACDGADKGVALPASFELDADGRAADWIRITLRLDYAARTYDVYVDGALFAADLRLGAPPQTTGPKQFMIRGREAKAIELDDFRLTATNPLYADADDDGLPDAYETAHGSNPNFNDRKERSANGSTRLEEFLAGLRAPSAERVEAQGATAQPGGRVIYVDATAGNDEFDGRQCYRVSGTGPKASVKAARAAANPGDTVVVLDGTYYEGNLNLTDANIHYKFTGHVKLR